MPYRTHTLLRPTLSTAIHVTRATLVDQIESIVRLDIMDGEFAPGQRLRFSDLSAKYGVSATPLREALQRLAAQNLIDWDPRLGATVAAVSAPELRDIYWLREMLEVVALRRSLERGGEDWIRGITDAWHTYEATERPGPGASRAVLVAWSEAHRDFHESIFAACDSPWLLRFVATLADHSERYRLMSAKDTKRDTNKEHALIFRAAIARDPDESAAALSLHLANTVAAVERTAQVSIEQTSTSGSVVPVLVEVRP